MSLEQFAVVKLISDEMTAVIASIKEYRGMNCTAVVAHFQEKLLVLEALMGRVVTGDFA